MRADAAAIGTADPSACGIRQFPVRVAVLGVASGALVVECGLVALLMRMENIILTTVIKCDISFGYRWINCVATGLTTHTAYIMFCYYSRVGDAGSCAVAVPNEVYDDSEKHRLRKNKQLLPQTVRSSCKLPELDCTVLAARRIELSVRRKARRPNGSMVSLVRLKLLLFIKIPDPNPRIVLIATTSDKLALAIV